MNEADVVDYLERQGVYIIDFDNQDIAARINLFRDADLVIGPHGEGLTDVVFCRPRAVLWEWMPQHLQNASYNRLAQAAKIDYRGDLFPSTPDSTGRGNWYVDIAIVARELSGIYRELRVRATNRAPDDDPIVTRGEDVNRSADMQPVDEVLLAFESLGNTCEFGLVQRHAGVEPLGLLRFAGISLPVERHVDQMVEALSRRFQGLGTPDSLYFYIPGEAEHGEFMARESLYNLQYHTGMFNHQISIDELRIREVKRLAFLRRKILDDLQAGEKIWVWQSVGTTHVEQVQPLVTALRALGPNTLLWVVECDDRNAPGTAERLDQNLIKGYVEHFPEYAHSLDLSAFSWIQMCRCAYRLCYPARSSGVDSPKPVLRTSEPTRRADIDDTEEVVMGFLWRLQEQSIGTVEPAKADKFFDDVNSLMTDLTNIRRAPLNAAASGRVGNADRDMLKLDCQRLANSAREALADPRKFPSVTADLATLLKTTGRLLQMTQ